MLSRNILKTTAIAVAALGLVSLAGCSGSPTAGTPASGGASAAADYQLVTPGTLTACSDVPFPPFEVEDTSSPSGYSGFDVDLATAIAQKIGLKFTLVAVDFTALQSGTVLVANQCDIGVSAITITDARKANIDFSDPYYDSLQSLLVKADSGITSLSQMDGKSIGVQSGTTGQTYATQHKPSTAKIVEFPSDGEEWAAIQAGQVDALLQDYPVNMSHEQADSSYKVVEKYQTGEQYGFAFAKGKSPALQSAVNSALAALRADGTYNTIYAKYFGSAPASGAPSTSASAG